MKNTKSLALALAAAGMGAFLSGCAEINPDGGNANIGDTSAVKNRAAVEKLAYMGGSAVYNGSDSSATQLAENAVVAVRLGKVEKTDLGSGNYSYKNSEADSELGYIEVNYVDDDGISFSYNKFNESGSPEYVSDFSLKTGESCDLNGDSNNDVKYVNAGNGAKNSRWLTFINDEDSGVSSMFSIIPSQYENGSYPAGLIGVNSNGRSVVTKYNVKTNGRALVSNIAYGDYVIDSESNTCQVYVGKGIKARSARALNDDELETIQTVDTEDINSFTFKPEEFSGNYSIYELLNAMPASIVKKDCSSATVTDATEYLNELIKGEDFIEKLLDTNSGDAVTEIRQQLNASPVSCEEERVLFNRHSLALIYPDLCPEYNLASASIAVVFPWLHVDLGQVATEDELEESSRSILAARSAAGETTNVPEYDSYLAKRKAIEDDFAELYSYDVAPLLGSIIGNANIASIMKQTKVQLKAGIAGHISLANADFDMEAKICVLASAEVQDCLSVNVAGTSLFAKEDPKIISAQEFKAKCEQTGADIEIEADTKDMFMIEEKAVKHAFDIDHWYFNFSNDAQTVNTYGYIYPSKDAKDFHVSFNPVKAVPFCVTFDGQFDVLFKLGAVVDFQNLYLGGICTYGVDVKCGFDWGFRDWYRIFGRRIAPKVTTFYFDPYGTCEQIASAAGYCGPKVADSSKTKVGGGIMAQLIPVVQVRGGVGIGGDAWIAEADATVGAKFTVAAPFGSYVGLNYNVGDKDLELVSDMGLNVVSVVGVDLQLYLDPPLYKAQRWHYDLYKDQGFNFQIFKVRTEGWEIVKSEGFKSL